MTEFEKLFNENREFIFKYLVKMTHDPSLSEELTQETFFRAYMNYASLRNKEKASVWLYQIAKIRILRGITSRRKKHLWMFWKQSVLAKILKMSLFKKNCLKRHYDVCTN